MLNHKHWFAGAASCIIDECGADPNDVYEAMCAAPPLDLEALAEEIAGEFQMIHTPSSRAEAVLAILQRATGRSS